MTDREIDFWRLIGLTPSISKLDGLCLRDRPIENRIESPLSGQTHSTMSNLVTYFIPSSQIESICINKLFFFIWKNNSIWDHWIFIDYEWTPIDKPNHFSLEGRWSKFSQTDRLRINSISRLPSYRVDFWRIDNCLGQQWSNLIGQKRRTLTTLGKCDQVFIIDNKNNYKGAKRDMERQFLWL